jgi:hypothetical protein
MAGSARVRVEVIKLTPYSKHSGHDIIADLIKRIDPAHPSSAETALSTLDVIELFESYLDPRNVASLSAIIEESYIHANGFYRISFPGTPSSPVRIRLHTWRESWDKDVQEDVPDAHNHKWPFASRILAGGLVHDILRVRPGEGPYEHFRHVDLGDRYQLLRAGHASLELTSVEVTTAGEEYCMTPETVHRVFPQAGHYSATLVAELERVRNVTDVFAGTKRRKAGQVKPRRLSVDEIVGEFHSTTKFLRGLTGA